MLINLSNHPNTNWSADQFLAAKKYSEIVDIPFPAIDPQLDPGAIIGLATEYLQIILEEVRSSEDPLNAVHLMGEMTFAFTLVAMLQNNNITCLASTSTRLVEELPDGKKTITFQFEQFREYPNLSQLS